MKLKCRGFFVIAILSLAFRTASAQLQAPAPPFASWGGGPFDMINLGNLGTRFTIPIIHKAGRGTPFSYDLTYDGSQVWSVVSANGYTKWEPNSNAFGWFNTSNAGSGGYISYDTVTSGGSCPIHPPYSFGSYTQVEYYDFVYHDSYGFNHLIPYDAYYITQNSGCSAPQSGPQPPQVEPALATDGSGYTMYATPGPNSISGYIVSKSGTQIGVPFTSGAPVGGSWTSTDLNGNMITESAGAWTDTLGTQVLAIAGTPPNNTTLTYVAPSGAYASYTIGYTNYTVQTWFQVSNGDPIIDYGPTANYLISYIALPDDSPSNPDRYTFTYEPTPSGANCTPLQGTSSCVTARLASITLPTGGTITYSYSGGPSGSGIEVDGTTAGLTRSLSPGGTWTYSRTVGSPMTTTITDPAGNQTLLNFAESYPSDNFYEEQQLSYQGTISGTACSQSVTTNCLLETVITCYNGASDPSTCATNSNFSEPVFQTTVFTYLPNSSGEESETNTTYDSSGRGLVQKVDSYDYGTGKVGNLLQSIITTYGSYNGGGCSPLGNGIYDHPCTVVVKDGSGNALADTTYAYDEGSPLTTSEPQHTGITGSRGNLTTVNSYTSTSTYLTQHFSYYDTGNVYQATDVNTAVTTYTYGACNNSFPTQVNLPLSLSTSESWDCNGGVPTSTTDMNSNQTTYSYDSMWRLNQTVFPLGGGETNVTYNPNSVVTNQEIDSTPRWRTTTAISDGFGRIAEQQDDSNPLGTVKVDTTYDALGRVSSVTNPYVSTSDPTYGVTKYTYDALGRVTLITDSDNSEQSSQYSGSCVTSSDEAEKAYEACYDGLGRLIQVWEDPAGNNYGTTYQYDALGDLTSVDQSGQSRTYTYDDLGRMTYENNPESGITTYTYDTCSAGDLCSRVRPKANQTNPSVTTTTTYTYDALHRLAGKSYDDGLTPAVYFGYDQSDPWGWPLPNTKGRLSTMGTSSTCGQVGYDSMGRVIHEGQCTPQGGYDPLAAYDLAGDLVQINYPSGRVVTYGYNAATQLTQATFASFNGTSVGSDYLTSASYAPTGAPTSLTFGNGLTETTSYNNRLEPTGQLVVSSTLTAQNRSYDFYPNGSVRSVNDNLDPQRNQSFTYDSLNRLATAQSAATSGSDCWGQSYGYDRYGNLLSQTVTQCSGPSWSVSASYKNQIAGFSYDAAGNLTFDGINSYQYDAEGRLININSGAMTYTYDAMGQRVYKDGSGQATSYINFGGQVLAEVDSNSSDWSDYIYGNGQRIARADTYEDRVHISGNNCSNCGWQYSTFSFANVAGLSGYVIQSGDHLFLRQFQSSGARGGITLSFASGQDMNWVTYDQDGQQSNSDTITNSWHYRNIDMSQWAGESVTAVTLVADGYTAPGSWDIYYQDIALVSANGTVHPIYSRETSMSLSIGGTDGSTRTYEVNHCCDGGATPETTTTYYSGDILGSIALLTSYNGYPVWSGTYLPFGYEWNPETTVNHYKFTGMERDSQPGETGLDHTWFRQYNSTMGRWMTPDPAGMAAADPTNPQTWNRYAYVGNNPLSFIDPLGACQVTSAYMNGYLVSTTYTIDNFDPCIIGSLPPGCGLVNTDRGFAGVFCSAAPSAPAMGATGDGSGAANNGQQPPHSPQHQQCVRSAIEKANFTVSGKIAENIKVPFKSAAVGAIDGGILGCLLTSEGGCFEGAIPGVLTGALGGAIEGTGDAVYHDITAYIQGMAQLKKDIAACPY